MILLKCTHEVRCFLKNFVEFIVIASAGLLVEIGSGCRHTSQDISSLLEKASIPSEFSVKPQKEVIHGPWWKHFGNQELEELIERGFKQNLNLLQVQERTRQAYEVIQQQEAVRAPSFQYFLQATEGRRRIPVLGRDPFHEYQFGLSGAYTVDLWGKLQIQVQTAQYLYYLQQENLKAAQLNLAYQITTLWLNIILNRSQQRLWNSYLKLLDQQENIASFRYQQGLGDSDLNMILEIRQAKEETYRQLDGLEASGHMYHQQLAVLLGEDPVKFLVTKSEQFPDLPLEIPIGIPLDLLSYRPDIRAILWQIHVQYAYLRLAELAWFPDLQLSLSWVYTTDELKDWFDRWIASLVARLTGSLWDHGLRGSRYRQQEAVLKEILYLYRDTLLKVVGAIEETLQRYDLLQKEKKRLEEILAIQNSRLAILQVRYSQGQALLKDLIVQQQKVIQTQQTLLINQQSLLAAYVVLCYQLGGEWLYREPFFQLPKPYDKQLVNEER